MPMRTRFIVSGYPRCGSTLLLDALEQHPNVKIFNEPFHEYLDGRYAVNGRKYQDKENGESFVRYIYGENYGDEKEAVGFKLFGQQARHDEQAITAWEYFRANKDVKVVYIDRENWLELVVSMQVAAKTNVWAVWESQGQEIKKKSDAGPIEVNPGQCEFFFRDIDKSRQWVFHYSIGHPVIRITYSELSTDFVGCLQRIHDFLEVPRHEPRMRTHKQATKTLAQRIANYDRLKRFFHDTPYRRFFEMEDTVATLKDEAKSDAAPPANAEAAEPATAAVG